MIHRGFLPVDPSLLEWILVASTMTHPLPERMSADGNAWHLRGPRASPEDSLVIPFIAHACALSGESRPLKGVSWWMNVLRDGAAYRDHTHDGDWAFVYHLTGGAAIHFTTVSYPVEAGQLIVFSSSLPHRTDKVTTGTRVSIAGNLYFSRRR
jgi:hypothetical protein